MAALISERLAKIEAIVERHDKDINGNGKPGLRDSMTEIITEVKEMKDDIKQLSEGVSKTDESIQSLIKFQTEHNTTIKVNTKRKELSLKNATLLAGSTGAVIALVQFLLQHIIN